ncbi:filamentous hemagglutinin N-terminal domain-containing protein [Calothrix sp. CCY 0018]|uniref:two-partner secretion domain-containing protein n=1 Tax=Calothrix sp. CCY 0018 TaxID=3103864 RepID=UPI0039C62119
MRSTKFNNFWNLRIKILLLGCIGGSVTSINPCFAQSNINIVPDKSLGIEASAINNNINNPDGIPSTLIEGGAERGQNLFHSLQEFNINQGRGAYFVVPNDTIQNVLTRVTGNNSSSINGILGTISNRNFDPTNANLFLINPNGIVFGENATLDVNGSFMGTSANAIKFGEQGFFSATNPQAPPLLTVNPDALLFNQINQNAAIQNNSVAPAGTDPAGFDVSGLRVPDGKSLLLLGGNVNMNGGNLNAYGGRVELGGLAAPGTVALDIDGDDFKLGFPENVTRGDVSLTNAFVFVEAAGGGDIAVNARNIEILSGSQLSAGIGQGLGTPETVAGDITLNATDVVSFDGITSDGFPSAPFNIVRSQSQGNAGNIDITTGSLSVTNGAQINSFTLGQGNAGNITIQATDTITFDGVGNGFPSASFSDVYNGATGRGGDISILAENVFIKNGAVISSSTYDEGDSGKISITARDTLSLFGEGRSGIKNDVRFGGVGDSGGISINTGSLFLSDLAVITSNVDGRGNSGGISIVARDLVSLEQPGELTRAGQAGTLILSRVNDSGEGNSGDIYIKTGSLRASNSQITTSTSSKGDSGSVIVEASDEVVLLRSTDIFTEVTCACETQNENGGDGKGGDIKITTGSLLLDSGSNLRADTEAKGDAGDIIINARDSITFSGSSEEFTSGAFSQVEPEAVGQGGDIIINTDSLSLSGDQEINTRTQGQGDAGNILINANSITLTGSDVRIISAASQQNRLPGTSGKGGDINITTNSLLVTDGAKLSANTEIQDAAGNININASQLTLNKRSFISSESIADANGGNILLNLSDFLLLRHGSQISTNAGTQQQGGDGGNINIDSKFIVAIPKENSDITANAFTGSGGSVAIDSQGVFGIEARIQQTDQSDITASSQQGVQGVTTINAPNNSNIQNSLIELAQNTIDSEALIATSCVVRSKKRNGTFYIIGSQGFPYRPGDAVPSKYSAVDVQSVPDDTSVKPRRRWKMGDPIVEPTGVYRLANGQSILSRECGK